MYDPHAALAAIDQHTVPIMGCLLITVVAVFIYEFIALTMAYRQKVYVVPFIGAAVFFWHDLNFVLLYREWFEVYDHWWVKMWWFALSVTFLLELFMVYQVFLYGHKELWPQLSRRAFGAICFLGTLGIGAMWFLVKSTLNDPLFFVTFAITAVWSVPFHTGILARRRSRAGQSVVMEACVVVMILSMSAAFSQVDPFFRSPVYLAFVGAFTLWPLVNIWLILKTPEYKPGASVAPPVVVGQVAQAH
jgi:hypothetical protein